MPWSYCSLTSGVPQTAQQHLWLYKYVKPLACSRTPVELRACESFSQPPSSLLQCCPCWPLWGTVRVNNVNKSWWAELVGTRSHSLNQCFSRFSPQCWKETDEVSSLLFLNVLFTFYKSCNPPFWTYTTLLRFYKCMTLPRVVKVILK